MGGQQVSDAQPTLLGSGRSSRRERPGRGRLEGPSAHTRPCGDRRRPRRSRADILRISTADNKVRAIGPSQGSTWCSIVDRYDSSVLGRTWRPPSQAPSEGTDRQTAIGRATAGAISVNELVAPLDDLIPRRSVEVGALAIPTASDPDLNCHAPAAVRPLEGLGSAWSCPFSHRNPPMFQCSRTAQSPNARGPRPRTATFGGRGG